MKNVLTTVTALSGGIRAPPQQSPSNSYAVGRPVNGTAHNAPILPTANGKMYASPSKQTPLAIPPLTITQSTAVTVADSVYARNAKGGRGKKPSGNGASTNNAASTPPASSRTSGSTSTAFTSGTTTRSSKECTPTLTSSNVTLSSAGSTTMVTPTTYYTSNCGRLPDLTSSPSTASASATPSTGGANGLYNPLGLLAQAVLPNPAPARKQHSAHVRPRRGVAPQLPVLHRRFRNA